ncbi:hypothetical protein ACIBG5_33885 [Kribbella sp. NPDC050241]|uniref:hypothetical protein n=1 Tax=Kribbella sp. NPDC050241 TaxID=3364115 RepID=UPI0037926B25
MVTTEAFEEPHSARRRWLRRASAAAIATAVLGIGGTGLSVAIVSARQADNGSTGTTTSSGTGSSSSGGSSSGGSSSSGSSSGGSSSDDSGSSGLGSASSGSTAQGGSNGS